MRRGPEKLLIFLGICGWLGCGSDGGSNDGGGFGGAAASGGSAGSSGGSAGSSGAQGGTVSSGGSSAGSGGSGPTPGARDCTSGPPTGPTFYVSEQGSDDNDCSEQAPCRTLQHAADVVSEAGSTVLVANGTYVGFHSVHDGITFKADGDSVVVDDEHSFSSGQAPDNINVENNDDVRVEGFIVRDADRAGIRVVNADDVVICNNTVGPNGKWGIFTGFAMRVQIVGNETFGSGDEHGIYVSNSDEPNDNPVVAGNVSHDNNFNGIQLNGDCNAGGDGIIEGALLEGNVLYNNGFKGFSLIGAPGVTVANNLIHDNGLNGGAGGVHLVKEPGCPDAHASSNSLVVNNTIIEPDIAAVRINDGATNNVVFNNILISERPAEDEVGGSFIDHNLTATSPDGIFAAGGFMLSEGSPARDSGVASFQNQSAPSVDFAGNARPQGAAYDLGAYESF